MIFESEIIATKNDIGLTDQLNEVLLLPNSHFPRLIFQDFMNQLKIDKIPLGFKQNTGQLIEELPNHLEEMDETVRFHNAIQESINNQNALSYFLLTQLLQTDFNINNIYVDNHSKQILYFRSKTPFKKEHKNENSKQLLNSLSFLTLKQKKEIIERFFILLGDQYQNKLLLFLTYLDTKYNFKLNKSKFIETSIGSKRFTQFKNYSNNLFLR